MKLTHLFLSIGLLLSCQLVSASSFCFQEHVSSSISINKERRKVYAKLTNGKSDRIFDKLISYEYLTMVPATYYDLRALSYHKKGMNLFCSEFMSMNRVPNFDPRRRTIPSEKFRPFDWKYYKARIIDAINHRDEVEVRAITLEALIELKKQPSYYCFTRHFMESIYRFAHYEPIRSAQAHKKNLKDPTNMMFEVMKLHVLGIKDCHEIDIWSQPIQKKGIPVLCSELPFLLSDIKRPELDILRN